MLFLVIIRKKSFDISLPERFLENRPGAVRPLRPFGVNGRGYRRRCPGDCNAGRLAKICSGPAPVSTETSILVIMVILVADCLSPIEKLSQRPTLSGETVI